MKSTLLFGTGSLLLLLAPIVAAPGSDRSARADDAAASAGKSEPLVVRDVSVFLLSAYGTKLNDRDLFPSTLPGYTLSRRPTAPRDRANDAIPMGIMTFSGPGESDVDVLLEFEQGRVLTHWPPGGLRSKRLLWSGIDVAPDVQVDPAALPEGHWLSPLRQSGRLMVKGNRSSDHFLLYDAELPYAPHLTLKRDESGGYAVTNNGAFAVRDVVVYRPASDDMWEVAAVAEVAAAPKTEAPAQAEAPAAAPATSPQPGQPEPTAASAAAPVAASPSPAAAAAAVVVQPGQPAPTAEGQPTAAPSQARPVPGTTASAPPAGTLTADQALQPWDQSLAALHLERPEIEFVLGILRQQALRRDSAMLVYRLDEAHLEQLLPLEVTPYPDRLFRVGLVIVQDADPDLQSRVDALVAQLGDDQWQQREAAQEQLAELGLAAKPKLEAALQNQDAEIVFRAEQLLEALQTQPAP